MLNTNSTFRSVAFITILILLSCKHKTGEQHATNVEEKVFPNISLVLDSSHIIYSDAVAGIKILDYVDDVIKTNKNLKIEKTILRTGEGDFDAYAIIVGDKSTIGYIYPSPAKRPKVWQIQINDTQYKTEKEIGVNSTLAEVIGAYPDIQVHGSEIEGRTHATIGTYRFRLDTVIWQYEIDISKINKNLKVLNVEIFGREPQ